MNGIKNKIKKCIVSSSLVCCLCTSFISVNAASDINFEYWYFGIMSDGVYLNMYDSNQHPVYPLSYQNTTYIPINEIEQICNKSIEVKENSITVSDNTPIKTYIRDTVYWTNGTLDSVNVQYYDKSFESNIIYVNNKAYLPIRTIAYISDRNVIWNDEYKTIVLARNYEDSSIKNAANYASQLREPCVSVSTGVSSLFNSLSEYEFNNSKVDIINAVQTIKALEKPTLVDMYISYNNLQNACDELLTVLNTYSYSDRTNNSEVDYYIHISHYSKTIEQYCQFINILSKSLENYIITSTN